MAIYRKREDFKSEDVELLVPAGDLLVGIYKLKDVPDCAIIAGYVREIETEEDIKNSPVGSNTPQLLFATPASPPPEILPRGEVLPPLTEPKGDKK